MKHKTFIIIIICILFAAPSYGFDYYRRYSFCIAHGVNMPDVGLMDLPVTPVSQSVLKKLYRM